MVVFRNIRGLAMVAIAVTFLSAFAEAQNQQGGQQEGRRRGGQEGAQQGGGQRGGGQRGGFGGGFGGGGFGGPGGGSGLISRAMLLGNEKVRGELKIEEAQAATVEAALEAYREEMRGSFQGLGDFREMSEEERAAFRDKMAKTVGDLNKKTDEVLNALLEPGQVGRLDQITLQARLALGAPAALKSDDLKAKLTITDEQVGKLTAIEEGLAKKRQEMMDGMRGQFQPGADREAMQAQFEKMRTEGEKLTKSVQTDAMAVLSADQKKALDELKGSPFEFDLRSLAGGRGFGGPGGGPGGFGGRGEAPGAPGGGRRERPKSDNNNL